MTAYIVLVPGDEAAWERATEEEREAVYGSDEAFVRLLEARGGKVTGGQELAPSSQARTLRRSDDGGVAVTDGPYTETTEQLSGFYLVECADLDVLQECLAPMVQAHGTLEIRPTGGAS